MTGLIFAKTMSPTTMATVIAVWSRSAVVSAMSASLRFAGADKAVRLEHGRRDRASSARLLRRTLDRVPLGDFLEARVPGRRVTLSHGDLRSSWSVRGRQQQSRSWLLTVDCES